MKHLHIFPGLKWLKFGEKIMVNESPNFQVKIPRFSRRSSSKNHENQRLPRARLGLELLGHLFRILRGQQQALTVHHLLGLKWWESQVVKWHDDWENHGKRMCVHC